MKNIRCDINDQDIKRAFNKYNRFLTELETYEECGNFLNKRRILNLAIAYKSNGLDIQSRKDVIAKFKEFRVLMDEIKQENPDANLKDISTQAGRSLVSEAIHKTQNDKKFKPADLEAVAVIKNAALYTALIHIREEGKDRNSELKENGISEEEFARAEASYQKYEKIGIMQMYDTMIERNCGKKPDRNIHYTAGALELRPSEARRGLFAMEQLEGKNNENKKFKDEIACKVWGVSQMIIDNIMRDPKLTPEEKNKKICELELAEYERVLKNVEEANRKQNTDRYKIVRENEEREIG